MNTGHSLEAERQSILDRMQMRRETYRRMLTEGADLDQIADVRPVSDGHAIAPAHTSHLQHTLHTSHTAQTTHAYRPVRHPAPTQFPRSTLMRTITEHPYLCALGVAAVVLIGPKRIARSVVGAGSTVSALAAGNQSNLDLVGKVLAMAGAYVQGRSNDNR